MWQYYLLGAFCALLAAMLSGAMSFVGNPITLLLVHLAGPLVRLCGRLPAVEAGFSSMGPYLLTSLCWPLIIVPLHYLNYGVLGWSHRTFAGLLLTGGVLVAFLVLLYHASPV
jgi:hypothetical protein